MSAWKHTTARKTIDVQATCLFFLHVNNPQSANPYATAPPSVAHLAQKTGSTEQNSWTKATSMQTSTVGGTTVLDHNCGTTLPDTLEVFCYLVAVIPSFQTCSKKHKGTQRKGF